LKMTSAYSVCDGKVVRLSATGHAGRMPLAKWKPEAPLVAASLHISAGDYAKFLLAILNRTGLSKAQWEAMLKPQFAESNLNSERTYCLGSAAEETPYGKKYSHSGRNSGGFSCYFAVYDEQKFGYVFFVNNKQASDFNEILEAYLVTGAAAEGDTSMP
jgi:Beta-lactamase